MVTGGAAVFISFIGFSEFLAFLPMVNMDYTPGLNFFFRGISGMNFKLYDMGNYVSELGFPESGDFKDVRFEIAGFDS